MSDPSTERGRTLWLGRHNAFAAAHLPAGAARAGVVLTSPLGWEEMASYPVRRQWAASLADRGFSVLRFDWPSTGDSPGEPRDPDRLNAWCEALDDAVEWLRVEAGVRRIATVGIGLGGLIAVEAIRRGVRSEDLALWPVHRNGKAYARAEQALSRLQSQRAPEDIEALPAGWLETSGYLLSADTIAALRAVPGWVDGPSSLERVLLFDRDGTPVEPEVIEGFRATGVDVRVGEGKGYTAMIFAPHWPKPPVGVIDQVGRWLGGAPPDGADGVQQVASLSELELPGSRERMLEVPTDRGAAFAIVTEPARRDPALPTVVFLPAWAERRSGPNRMWAEGARRIAARGGVAVRVDLPGVGDSIGDREWLAHELNVIDPRIVTEIRGILGALGDAGLGTEFVLVGLSVGGYWAFQVLAADPRVAGALAVNPGVDVFSSSQQADEVMSKLHYILRPSWWGRIIRGELQLSTMFEMARTAIRARLRARRQVAGGPPPKGPLLEAFETIGSRGAWLTVATVGDERLDPVLAAEGVLDRLPEWPRVRMVDIDTLDHNVRPVPAQRQVHALIDELVGAASAVPTA